MSRMQLYVLLNAVVAISALVGYSLHNGVANPAYVVILFALCSTPLIETKPLNGPYALLGLWSAFYFTTYGMLDLRNLIFGIDGEFIPDEGFDAAEVLILLSCGVMQIAYRVACKFWLQRKRDRPIRNWPESVLVPVGLVLWVISSRLCWEFSVNLVTEKSTSATLNAFASIGDAGVSVFMLARMMQPLSILMIAYAQARYRRAYMVPLVVIVVLYQLFYGFVIDTKGEAMTGGILVILTNLLVNGRVPKTWLSMVVLVVAVAFPVLQANRVVRDEQNLNATKASQDLGQILEKALNAKDRVNRGNDRAQTLLERTTTKGSVELIVRGTGSDAHPFQHGYTLMPLVTAFVPRLIWADKPSVSTGQILNREFHISGSTETFISPSHLGDLYWNFGWPGALLGMSIVGLLMGTLGAKFDLAEAATITRLLVVVVTVRQLIIASEGEFAVQYVVWMRSMMGIGLLHLLFARAGNLGLSAKTRVGASVEPRSAPFPNLLR